MDIVARNLTVVTSNCISSFRISKHTDYCWSVEALWNTGKATFRSEQQALEFIDAVVERREYIAVWAIVMSFYTLCQMLTKLVARYAHQTSTQRSQQRVIELSGINTGNPSDSHRVLYQQWAARHALTS